MLKKLYLDHKKLNRYYCKVKFRIRNILSNKNANSKENYSRSHVNYL